MKVNMKTILVSSLLLFLSFSGSKAQDIPTFKMIKEWCIALSDQNKELTYKLTQKDSIVNAQDRSLALKEGQIKSYKGDSTKWYTRSEAYKLMFDTEASFTNVQRREIRRLKKKNTITFGALMLAISVIVIDFFTDDEDN